MANKIDSNITGLRYAQESSLGVLPGTPIWYPLEPNSYKDFGGQLTTMAREPIDPSRQRAKGTVVDLEASGGWNQDLTKDNLTRLLQGVLFADAREKASNRRLDGSLDVNVSGIVGAAGTITFGATVSGFLVNSLVHLSGFGLSANSGLKKLSAATGTVLTTTGLADETPAAGAGTVQAVGYEFASATLDVVIVSGLPRLTRMSGTVDFTTLGLVPGEFIYVGGDLAAESFANNKGFARVKAVGTTYIELDKTDWTPQAEVGTAKTIRIFFGQVIKNENTSALIKRRTYNIERTLGADSNGTMSEYLVGACANEFSLDIKQADKVTVDLGFVATDNQQRDGLTGVKSGTRPTASSGDAFNTSSDFSRIKLSLVSATPNPTALYAFATELKLEIKNNITPNKAIGTLGAFDTSAGMLEVGGSMTAYFGDITAVQAVRNNSDVTLDFVLAKSNAGIAVDVPLIALGDGRLNVEKDKAIELPLEVNAAVSPTYGHTILISAFPYLPTAAC